MLEVKQICPCSGIRHPVADTMALDRVFLPGMAQRVSDQGLLAMIELPEHAQADFGGLGLPAFAVNIGVQRLDRPPDDVSLMQDEVVQVIVVGLCEKERRRTGRAP